MESAVHVHTIIRETGGVSAKMITRGGFADVTGIPPALGMKKKTVAQ